LRTPLLTEKAENAIEELATLWLETERDARKRSNAGGSEERARAASAAYEHAVTSAFKEELLVAWHAALQAQYECEMGSASWADARAVSELLRVEYLVRGGTDG
jgi:hypothetical protein